MRKLLLFCMIAMIAIPSVFAGRKKDYAGKVKDYVFTDKKYDFSITLDDKWKSKVQKNKSDFRMVLTKIKYAVPPDYAEAPDYTKIPRMVLYVVESKLSPKAFIDSLVSPSFKSDAKKTILREAEILNMIKSTGFVPEKLVTRKKKTLRIGDIRGAYWTGQVKYTNEVSVSATSEGGKRVKGGFGGFVAAVRDGDNMIVFHLITEKNYFESELNDAMEIIKSLKLKE